MTTRHPFTDDPTTIPHSGLCDAGKVTWVREPELGPASHRPVVQECTCGAGLLRMLGGRA